MFDIPRSYLPACSNAVSPVPLQRIIMIISILSHYYKELTELKAQVEHMKGEKRPKEVLGQNYTLNAGTLDRYFVVNNKMKQPT